MTARKGLLAGALALALLGALFGRGTAAKGPVVTDATIAQVGVFDLGRTLSEQPPDVVVLTLGEARHPLLGATPAQSLGANDDEIVARAPKHRRIILAGSDAVRVDRIARRLFSSGRDVRVLAGGTDAWDRAMDGDPTAPPQADGAAWQSYLRDVALRHYFGDKSSAPATVAPAVVAPANAGASEGPKKREGC